MAAFIFVFAVSPSKHVRRFYRLNVPDLEFYEEIVGCRWGLNGNSVVINERDTLWRQGYVKFLNLA